MQTLSYRFEDAPLTFTPDTMRCGEVSGVAEISYAESGEWFVTALSLSYHNGKLGAAAIGENRPVSRAYQPELWFMLVSSLETFSRPHIQDAVEAALEDGAIGFATADAEHRLRTWELV